MSDPATLLRIDAAAVAEGIASALRTQLGLLRRRGCVVAMSGGVDSSVCAGLAVRALGTNHVFGIFLPFLWIVGALIGPAPRATGTA